MVRQERGEYIPYRSRKDNGWVWAHIQHTTISARRTTATRDAQTRMIFAHHRVVEDTPCARMRGILAGETYHDHADYLGEIAGRHVAGL